MPKTLLAALAQGLAFEVPAAHYLVGVSGGRDSVALLDALMAIGFCNLLVCHLDHQLRAESAKEASFVESLCARYQLPFILARVDVQTSARRQKLSIETAARQARYEFFARVAAERQCPCVLLAHHADDQIETLLQNLFRGAGPRGLGGMRPASLRLVAGTELTLLRPLLGVRRTEIDSFIAARHLKFCEDPSNADPEYTRNRVRHQLLPTLEQIFGRQVCQTLWRTAELMRAEDAYISAQVPPCSAELTVDEVRRLPEALQRRLIHAWLKFHAVPNLGFETIERVRALVHSRPAKANLPGGRHVRRRAKRLFLEDPI